MGTDTSSLHIDVPLEQLDIEPFSAFEQELRKIETEHTTEIREKSSTGQASVVIPLSIISTLIHIVTKVEERMSQPPNQNSLKREKDDDYLTLLIAARHRVTPDKVTPEFLKAIIDRSREKVIAEARAEGQDILTDEDLRNKPFSFDS